MPCAICWGEPDAVTGLAAAAGAAEACWAARAARAAAFAALRGGRGPGGLPGLLAADGLAHGGLPRRGLAGLEFLRRPGQPGVTGGRAGQGAGRHGRPGERGVGDARRRGRGRPRPGHHGACGDARQGQRGARGDDRDLGGPAVEGLAEEGLARGSPSAEGQREPSVGRIRAGVSTQGTGRPPRGAGGGPAAPDAARGQGARPLRRRQSSRTRGACELPGCPGSPGAWPERASRPYEKDHTKKTV